MNYINLFIILLLSLKVNSQANIIALEDIYTNPVSFNDYYQDTNSYLNQFVGSWQYTNGNTIFKIVLSKSIMVYDRTNKCHLDALVGEYKYVENGVVKINTLPSLNHVYDYYNDHKIYGFRLKSPTDRPVCTTCTPNEKRVKLLCFDPVTKVSYEFFLKHTIINGVEQLNMYIRSDGLRWKHTPQLGFGFDFENVIPTIPIPANSEYILIKQ